MYKANLLLASMLLAAPLSINFFKVYAEDSIFSDKIAPVFTNKYDSDQSAEKDYKLQEKIQHQLSAGWFSKGYEDVSVRVKKGAVTLDGYVKTMKDKKNVEEEVRNLEGVKSLTSNIRVQERKPGQENSEYPQDTAASPTDKQLNYKIRDQISSGFWSDYKNISLNTSDGVVKVEGRVDNLKDEKDVIQKIRNVEGVKSVKSKLKVKEDK